MRKLLVTFSGKTYRIVLRPLIFLFNSEIIHDFLTQLGFIMGKTYIGTLMGVVFRHQEKELNQKLFGIEFANPIGLSAGFDYNAKLMDILPNLGFGFESIGTITNSAYEGNPKPRLARLVKSKALLVNKGFKNEGIIKISERLSKRIFAIPIGLSIGKTNTTAIKTQKQAVEDILMAFAIAEKSKINISYYELNISCPNLYGNIDFYESNKLNQLLKAVFSLNLTKPVFVKMPITFSDKDVIKMMDVIIKYPVKAVIFGNLQKDRNNEYLVKSEIAKYPVGNFSGKPTEKRSNELIALVYRKYSGIKIIGCGGVFNAQDAYNKIKLGASLVEFITGLIFEGPQLASEINFGLIELLRKDGYTHISQAVGVDANKYVK